MIALIILLAIWAAALLRGIITEKNKARNARLMLAFTAVVLLIITLRAIM